MERLDKLQANSILFGIMCNFQPHCGEERAKEAREFVKNAFDLVEAYQATNLTPAELADKLSRLEKYEQAEKDGRLLPEGFVCIWLSDGKTLAVFHPERARVCTGKRELFGPAHAEMEQALTRSEAESALNHKEGNDAPR
jgi:hypothetical protein